VAKEAYVVNFWVF